MAFFNQNSFLLVVFISFVALILFLWQWRSRSRLLRIGIGAWFILGALLLGLAVQYPTLEGTPTSVNEIEATLNNDRATLIMFYSDY